MHKNTQNKPGESILPRLNKVLADAGLCSRRGADSLIFAGEVRVNGVIASSPGQRIDPARDKVEVRGRTVRLHTARGAEKCRLMLHKPVRVVSTVRDPQGRQTVLDLLPQEWKAHRLYPAGRLDYFSEGLLLLTDDGELSHRITHPRWHLPRVYEVTIRPDGVRLQPAMTAMRRGMTLAEGEKLAPVQVRILEQDRRAVTLEMILHQGLNRQIRRMCRDLGLTILRLRRVRQGPLALGDLPCGAVRPLTEQELTELRRALGLDAPLDPVHRKD